MGFFRRGPGGIEIEWASNILGPCGAFIGPDFINKFAGLRPFMLVKNLCEGLDEAVYPRATWGSPLAVANVSGGV